MVVIPHIILDMRLQLSSKVNSAVQKKLIFLDSGEEKITLITYSSIIMEQKDKAITALLKAYGLADMYCKDGIVQDDKYYYRYWAWPRKQDGNPFSDAENENWGWLHWYREDLEHVVEYCRKEESTYNEYLNPNLEVVNKLVCFRDYRECLLEEGEEGLKKFKAINRNIINELTYQDYKCAVEDELLEDYIDAVNSLNTGDDCLQKKCDFCKNKFKLTYDYFKTKLSDNSKEKLIEYLKEEFKKDCPYISYSYFERMFRTMITKYRDTQEWDLVDKYRDKQWNWESDDEDNEEESDDEDNEEESDDEDNEEGSDKEEYDICDYRFKFTYDYYEKVYEPEDLRVRPILKGKCRSEHARQYLFHFIMGRFIGLKCRCGRHTSNWDKYLLDNYWYTGYYD